MIDADMCRHEAGDWCHLCGRRESPLADIWYAENAERDKPVKSGVPRPVRYVRICASCGDRIGRVARDKLAVPVAACGLLDVPTPRQGLPVDQKHAQKNRSTALMATHPDVTGRTKRGAR